MTERYYTFESHGPHDTAESTGEGKKEGTQCGSGEAAPG